MSNVGESGTINRGVAMLRDKDDWLWPYLSPAEDRVLAFIIRRTYLLGRLRWGISVKEMERGVCIEGVYHCAGTGLSRSTIKRGLAKLETRSLIYVTQKALSKFHSINVYEVDEDEFDNLVERSRKNMARKRGTDRGVKMTPGGVQNEPLGGSNRTTPRSKNTEKEDTEGGAERELSLSEAVDKGEKKYREGIKRRLKKHKKPGPPSMTAVNDYLKVIISRHELQSIAPLTQKDYGVFKKNWLASPEPYDKVMDWAIPLWGTIRHNHFDSDRKFPLIPNMRYLAYNWRRLLDAYREDMRNALAYEKADERKATRLRKVVDKTVEQKEQAEDRIAELERENEEKEQKIKELESVHGYDDGAAVFRKLYHGHRR